MRVDFSVWSWATLPAARERNETSCSPSPSKLSSILAFPSGNLPSLVAPPRTLDAALAEAVGTVASGLARRTEVWASARLENAQADPLWQARLLTVMRPAEMYAGDGPCAPLVVYEHALGQPYRAVHEECLEALLAQEDL